MKILVIGDQMTDCYWHGSVSRISPVAPVPIVRVDRTEARPGAAANVAANIEAMGVEVERIFGTGGPIQKITVYAGQHIARLDFDCPQTPILPDEAFLEAAIRCDLIVASDYGKGSLARISDLIAASGRPFFIDPKGHDYTKYRGAALVKPNRDEMRDLLGGWSTPEEMDSKARQFLASSGVGSLLLTQAGEGMTLYTPNATLHQEAQNKAPVDVSGAGEAALSAYAVAFLKGYELGSCLRFASKAAAIAISKPGTVVVSNEDLHEKA